MWVYDGVWHRFDSADLSITVLEDDPPTFELAVDVAVEVSGQRYGATFMTPEQIRACLSRWMRTGETLPGEVLAVPDLVVVGSLSLDGIAAAVRFHLSDGAMRSPFVPLEENV